VKRRTFIKHNSQIALGLISLSVLGSCQTTSEENAMYGIIGKMLAQQGKRDELISILLAGTHSMPGCKSYIISKDSADQNALWIHEVWENKDSHVASLKLEAVQSAIAKGKPLIAGFGERFETEPVGGHGLT
jgi:quinol monooxygenase YgiN